MKRKTNLRALESWGKKADFGEDQTRAVPARGDAIVTVAEVQGGCPLDKQTLSFGPDAPEEGVWGNQDCQWGEVIYRKQRQGDGTPQTLALDSTEDKLTSPTHTWLKAASAQARAAADQTPTGRARRVSPS